MMSTKIILLLAIFNSVNSINHYTAQKRSQKFSVCSGPCIPVNTGLRFNTSYFSCQLSDGDWDYCSPDANGEVVKTQFTHHDVPCSTPCERKRKYFARVYLCINQWGIESFCSTKTVTYLQAQSIYGDDCAGECRKDNHHHYRCRTERKKWKYCAPSRFSEFLRTRTNKIQGHISEGSCSRPIYDAQHRGLAPLSPEYLENRYSLNNGGAPDFVTNYALTISSLGDVGEVVIGDLNQQHNPVYRYVVLDSNLENMPVLPLIIYANVTSGTLNERGSRCNNPNVIPSAVRHNVGGMGRNTGRPDNNNDENGHLIAYQNGGPNGIFNFVPQTRNVNRGVIRGIAVPQPSAWLRAENRINAWVRGGQGWVHEVVAVMYGDLDATSRPCGFATHVIFYNNDGSVNYECEDYYSNDPDGNSRMFCN